MSTQARPEPVQEQLSDDAVYQFLLNDPDFFERYASLLGTLRLPHAAGGGAVSLVERQVSVLRQRNLKLERKLKELIAVARANDVLVSKIHRLALQLLMVNDLARTLEVTETGLRTGFGADESVLVLFGDSNDFADIPAGRFFRPTPRESADLQPFTTFLSSNNPRCGQVRDAQRDFLFSKDTDEIGSAALVPLGEKSEIGFLAIGSADANRFHPGMSIDFLARMGELVAEALKRF